MAGVADDERRIELVSAILRAIADQFFVHANDAAALVIMLYDAGQLGFAGQVFIQVVEFKSINGSHLKYAATFWNFEQVDRFHWAKLALRPQSVEGGDFPQCLCPCPRVSVVEDARRQIPAPRSWIIFFTRCDERFNYVNQLRCNFLFFRRRGSMDFVLFLSQFAFRQGAEEH